MMNADRWNHVQELLLQALERDLSERDAFVDEVSEGDASLRHELTSLLKSHDATGLLDAPPDGPDTVSSQDRLEEVQRALGARYDVERAVGHGGTATVYRALDLRHDRPVAIKVLRPELASSLGARHFLREIEISAQLRHPHILPLFDSGESNGLLYFVMPLAEDETLRQRLTHGGTLSIDAAVRLGCEVAEALGYAHARGVVHRDVKPANILLEAGHAVVADFGIGRALDVAGDTRLTRTGMIVGTPRYMSPEQASGERLDGRADLYSLGCVIFEMIAGRPPFDGESAAWIIRQHLVEEAPRVTAICPDVPDWLASAVATALSKRPSDRFSTADELADALREGGGGTTPARPADQVGGAAVVLSRPAVAVLPFINVGRDEEQEYFADGLTEDLITALSTSRWFPVIARNSSFAYKGSNTRVQDVARELGARYVVEGSVRRDRDRVRISAQLIDGHTGQNVWAHRYDRELTDIFDIQDELSETICAAVEPEMGKAERTRARTRAPGNLDAWESCQLGMWHFHQYTGEHFALARTRFERALELDDTLVAALVGISETYYYELVLGLAEEPQRRRALVLDVAQQAVDLDERDAYARCALGRARVVRREHDEAIPEFEVALQLSPSLARAHYGLGAANVFRGTSPDGIEHLEAAIRLSPRDLYMGSFLVRMADAHLFMRDHEGAVEWSRRALRQTGFQWSRYATLVSALAHLGRTEEAQAGLSELLARRPDFSIPFVRATHLFTHAPDMEHFVQGLELAGTPA